MTPLSWDQTGACPCVPPILQAWMRVDLHGAFSVPREKKFALRGSFRFLQHAFPHPGIRSKGHQNTELPTPFRCRDEAGKCNFQSPGMSRSGGDPCYLRVKVLHGDSVFLHEKRTLFNKGSLQVKRVWTCLNCFAAAFWTEIT